MTEPTARILSALVGPVVIYQPMKTQVADGLTALADEGLIEIRSPLAEDEPRLKSALNEFLQWAAQNPGHAGAGAGFVGAQQGKIPFFDESTINRIRSDIKSYQKQPEPKDDEIAFSARLFLAVAEENDRTTSNLNNDLQEFKALEQGFLESLVDGDEADFKRQLLGGGVWQEDPGARQTGQRLRAWACLVGADDDPPDCLITTSTAVMDTLVEKIDPSIFVQQVGTFRCRPAKEGHPLLVPLLTDLISRDASAEDIGNAFTQLDAEDTETERITVSAYMAADISLSHFIEQIGPVGNSSSEEHGGRSVGKHTLILLVEADSKAE